MWVWRLEKRPVKYQRLYCLITKIAMLTLIWEQVEEGKKKLRIQAAGSEAGVLESISPDKSAEPEYWWVQVTKTPETLTLAMMIFLLNKCSRETHTPAVQSWSVTFQKHQEQSVPPGLFLWLTLWCAALEIVARNFGTFFYSLNSFQNLHIKEKKIWR